MNEKSIQEALSNEDFVKGLLAMETSEEVQNAFKQKGIEISPEEVLSLRDALIKIVEKADRNGGELSVEDLDDVAGGVNVAVIATVVCTAVSAIFAAAGATAICKNWRW